jgi:hypothetical protein|tara:strand:+ start:270 stop:428 length:159 start_codon:yes stop_codon:yes gene_type:complete
MIIAINRTVNSHSDPLIHVLLHGWVSLYHALQKFTDSSRFHLKGFYPTRCIS